MDMGKVVDMVMEDVRVVNIEMEIVLVVAMEGDPVVDMVMNVLQVVMGMSMKNGMEEGMVGMVEKVAPTMDTTTITNLEI
jgi:hypothetical protein